MSGDGSNYSSKDSDEKDEDDDEDEEDMLRHLMIQMQLSAWHQVEEMWPSLRSKLLSMNVSLSLCRRRKVKGTMTVV